MTLWSEAELDSMIDPARQFVLPLLPEIPPQPNPCVREFGRGPEGERCQHCAHLFLQRGVQGRYFKCDLRPNTRGPGTDHRARWDACAQFVAMKS